METIVPGIYEGITNEDYHTGAGLSSSDLKRLSQSPLHYKTSKAGPCEETEAMRFGTAVHTAVLEPERFDDVYVRAPEGSRNSKAVKTAWAELEEMGKIPLSSNDFEAIQGMRDDWLASFMIASILLNPQLIVYSTTLGPTALVVRMASCFLCGIAAGLVSHFCYRGRPFFDFTGFHAGTSRDTDPNLFMRYIKNFGRNVRATGPWFLLGIFLTALFQRYVPAESFARLFGRKSGFGVLMAATIGVPLYACGGGTIPLLQQWLADGMSMGSAAAFMITGPATKITNLGALKIVLGAKHFALYLLFVMIFSLVTGLITNVLM